MHFLPKHCNGMKSRGNYKYQLAFALLDGLGNPVKMWIDEEAEPSKWLAGAQYSYELSLTTSGITAGAYQWGVAIVDKTKNNTPGIKLAIKDNPVVKGWTIIASATVE